MKIQTQATLLATVIYVGAPVALLSVLAAFELWGDTIWSVLGWVVAAVFGAFVLTFFVGVWVELRRRIFNKLLARQERKENHLE